MSEPQNKDPLHGITLEQIVNSLVDYYGWEELGELIDIRCFKNDPSVKSSLKFLRRAPWARKQVEDLYLAVKRTDRTSEDKKPTTRRQRTLNGPLFDDF